MGVRNFPWKTYKLSNIVDTGTTVQESPEGRKYLFCLAAQKRDISTHVHERSKLTVLRKEKLGSRKNMNYSRHEHLSVTLGIATY